VYLVAGPLSEEPGWSGFLYPHLRQSRARAHAVAVYGPLWALWHLPLFFIGGTAQNALGGGGVLHWTLTVFILAYLISSANHAGGVLAAVTVHFAYNVSQALLQMDGPAEMTIHVVLMLATCLVVARREQRTVPERPERTPITD
jgi:membrane protease YdiL (CAAX protease family)